jgi:hypothetical protein
MISRCIALLFTAISLAGCCASNSGCYAPVAAGSPVAWDGLGPVAAGDRDGDHKPKRSAAQKHDFVVGPLEPAVASSDAQPQANDRWAQDQSIDQEADAKLNGQLKICHGC